MELCICGLLDHLTKYTEKISIGEKIRYAIDVAEGMYYLQAKTLVHRDLGRHCCYISNANYFLASRNCLFSRKGTCKVADFGLSKLMKNLEGERVKSSQMPVRWMGRLF